MELARLAHVTPAAITKAARAELKDACVGKRIDLDHPATQEYLRKHGVDTTSPAKPAAEPQLEPTVARPPNADEVRTIGDMKLREVVQRFGGQGPGAEGAALTRIGDWQARLKASEEIREKRLRNEEAEGKLIERELVRVHVFGMIDAGNRRLLSDAPRTIARRLYAMAKSGVPVEDAERVVRETISSQLQVVKTHAEQLLRDGRDPSKAARQVTVK